MSTTKTPLTRAQRTARELHDLSLGITPEQGERVRAGKIANLELARAALQCSFRQKARSRIGQRFGRLVVLGIEPDAGKARARCRCDCGTIKVFKLASVVCGQTNSCGCRQRENSARAAAAIYTHRMSRTRIYRRWSAMKDRCANPHDKSWHRYGGRGIRVCERWQKFENFLADLGEPPPGTSLDRIDVNGDYEPGNCRWADFKTQSNNKRTSRFLTFNGRTQTIAQWADEAKIPSNRLRSRLDRGWDIEKALNQPSAASKGRTHVTEE